MSETLEIVVVRHGESKANAEARMQGRFDSPLNDRGRAQAHVVGRWFASQGMAHLRTAGYRGWLVVEGEQDPAVAPSYRYADMGFRYLRALLDGDSEADARALSARIRQIDIEGARS